MEPLWNRLLFVSHVILLCHVGEGPVPTALVCSALKCFNVTQGWGSIKVGAYVVKKVVSFW